jgi:glutaredoxin
MKVAVIYTMKGCSFCTMMKEEMVKENIDFLERDIDECEEEYDEFVSVTENEFVPALMLLTIDEEENVKDILMLAPDRDYQDIYEGMDMVKKYFLN